MRSADDLFAKCERDGEDIVRKRMAENIYCSTKEERSIVQEWLRRKDEGRNLASSSKRDAREEETLSIANEANLIASRALDTAESEARLARRSRWIDRIIPMIAIIIAAIAARDDIKWLISWLIDKIKTP